MAVNLFFLDIHKHGISQILLKRYTPFKKVVNKKL